MSRSLESRLDKLLSNYKENKAMLCVHQEEPPCIPDNFNGYIIWIKNYGTFSKRPI